MVDKERLSALVDGEVDDSELRRTIADLAADAEERARWYRYHLIGGAMRGQLPTPVTDLSGRVARAVDAETPAGAVVVPFKPPRLSRPLVGLAVAASVTAVAILSVQILGPVDNAPMVASTTIVTPPEPGEATSMPDRRLNPYLINHNEYAAATGMPGVLPYVRVVSHDGR